MLKLQTPVPIIVEEVNAKRAQAGRVDKRLAKDVHNRGSRKGCVRQLSLFFITQQESEGCWRSGEARKQNPVPATFTSVPRPTGD